MPTFASNCSDDRSADEVAIQGNHSDVADLRHLAIMSSCRFSHFGKPKCSSHRLVRS